jgi:hypothetical protein
MRIALAATYNPRGEIPRLQRYYPQMQAVYSDIIISLPPSATPEEVQTVAALPNVNAFVNGHWSEGRYRSLKAASDTGADFLHYVDLDRLIRWVETRPDEWLATVEQIQTCDCLVIGRTEAAWATHPQVMIQVEEVINSVFSYLLGAEYDIGSGSKGFSRRAAAFILANSEPGDAIGTDAEWPVLCHRAGFTLASVLVDGMDWEIPDQYQDRAADLDRQMAMAAAYDEKVESWKLRVGTTREVIRVGLETFQRPLKGVPDAVR